jgi:hypothetical protein
MSRRRLDGLPPFAVGITEPISHGTQSLNDSLTPA